jgi:hypothetical protein
VQPSAGYTLAQEATRLAVIEAVNSDPVNFAGAYIDQDGMLVILYVGTNAGRATIDSLLTPGAAVRWRQVARSWADLMTIVDQIRARAQAGDSSLVDVFAISIDTINNQVEVTVGPGGSVVAVSRGLENYGDAVRVEFSSDIPVVH